MTARANVLAHLASARRVDAGQVRKLAAAQGAIREEAPELVARAREKSKVPPVTRDALVAALDDLAARHADALAAGSSALPDGCDVLASIICAKDAAVLEQTAFFRHVIAGWERNTSPEVSHLLDEAGALEESLLQGASLDAAKQLRTFILRFAALTKPAQAFCTRVGLRHGASDDAMRRWRSVALDLNNEQDAVAEAILVLGGLAKGFGIDGEFGKVVAGDLKVCNERLASGEAAPEIQRLSKAIDLVAGHPAACEGIDWFGTGIHPGLSAAGIELQRGFVAATMAVTSDLPWRMLRALALRFHNELHATAAALALTRLAIKQAEGRAAAQPILAMLLDDRRTLQRSVVENQLERELKRGNTALAHRLLAQLVTLTDDAGKRRSYEGALERMQAKAGASRVSWGLAAVALAGIVLPLVLLSGNNNDGRQTAILPQQPSYAQAPTQALPATAAPPTVPAADSRREERQPGALPGSPSLDELRWCLYRDARAQAALDFLQVLRARSDYSVPRYNAAVGAYDQYANSLDASCARTYYRPGDKAVVDAELARYATALRWDGESMVLSAFQAVGSGWAGPMSSAQSSSVGTAAPPPAPYLPSQPVPPANAQGFPLPASSIVSAAFTSGQADRRAWEAWFEGLAGDYREGALWWSGVRSAPRPPPCTSAPGADRFAVEAGCNAARLRLAQPDRRRRTEPDYKAGWNDP